MVHPGLLDEARVEELRKVISPFIFQQYGVSLEQ